MAIASKSKWLDNIRSSLAVSKLKQLWHWVFGLTKSFQRNLLLSIGGVFLLFAICFSFYQYQREKDYKIDILHSRLQMYNYEMVQTLGEDSLTNQQLFATMWPAIRWKGCVCR